MHQQSAFEYVLDKLDGVKRRGDRAEARCPAHEDHTPSLSVCYEHDRVLLKCHAGCDTSDVLAHLGLGWEALFDKDPEHEVMLCQYRYQRPDGAVHMTVERWRTPIKRKTFRQFGSNGEPLTKSGTRPCLYNLPEVIPAARAGGEIWIVEGEKDVHACRANRIVATTAPMGTDSWLPYYWRWLHGAKRVVVVADDDTVGRRSAAKISADLRSHGFRVDTVVPAAGCKDAADHFAAGFPASAFRKATLNRLRPPGVSHRDLIRNTYPPVSWAVPDLLPAGLAILGGTVKIGKSWLALDIALGVGRGLTCLGGFTCQPGAVLYLALDNDSERRLQTRVANVTLDAEDDPPIEFHTEWPTGADAVAAVQEWITEVTRPRLVVVDTLVRVEPDFDKCGSNGAYSQSTEVLSRWARLAQDNDLTVLAVHHDRKTLASADVDWVDRFSGSRGLTASAATLLFLDAQRGASHGMLRVTGRDVTAQDLELYQAGGLWHAVDLLRAAPGSATKPVNPAASGDNVTDIHTWQARNYDQHDR